MKKLMMLCSVMLLFALFLAGCGNEDSSSSEKKSDGKLTIYTTIYPIEDFTKKIGGDNVTVKSVIPNGVDAHSFEPTTKDMLKIAKADAFIYSGAGAEGFADAANKTLKDEDVKMIKAAEGAELVAGHDDHDHEHGEEHGDEHEHGDLDPHFWLDPQRSIVMAENIKNALSELEPSKKDEFEKNFNQVKTDLEELDKKYEEAIKNAPSKEILVSHAAYGYWEDRYGIEQISVSGLSPTQEPSQKELKEIVETAKEHNIKYVIFDANVTNKIATLVRKEIGAESLTLNNMETLRDQDRENGEDYFSLMNKNLEALKKALNSK
ncbi:zinc ABC transporter substrate-binding protein [Priestia filamentosa]|uniref:metal ABC transporter substrate-binding protein n=1 Tax=Priestia filamentosa TaxID=1402861 RepID=UPI001FB3796E|nr:metal ABC transporter substrate-binding protein [Priestia filamentosa]MED3728199.1 metal ABC transporter substrate-binding protein [Priestia filamentosa]UOE59846.1 zinc ABC transporter substrate-binding protein [Priestia filamentosa]